MIAFPFLGGRHGLVSAHDIWGSVFGLHVGYGADNQGLQWSTW